MWKQLKSLRVNEEREKNKNKTRGTLREREREINEDPMRINIGLTASYLCLEACKAADPKDLARRPFLVAVRIKLVLDEGAHRRRDIFRMSPTPAVVPIRNET